MPDEMREYENQEMESNESPVPQEDEEYTVEGIQKEQAPAMEEPAASAVPAQTSAHRSHATQLVARRSSVVASGAQLQAGQEFAQDGRKILRDAVAYAKERGVKVNFGAENDFYLFRTDEEGEPTDIPFDSAGFLDEAPEDRGEDVRRDICLTLEAMGIEPQYSQHISGPGQNRIDFAPGPALACADNVITFRSVVKMMAARNGLWAAFSPKPIPDQAGNGFRIAMRPTRQGESCADAFLAGVLERFQEMQVFFNPREESYERLGTFGAPASVSWADTGRGALLRRKADGRLELSAADGAANPYLAFSLLIYAGVDGVQRGLSPAGLETGQPLAATLGEAKARCKESAFLQGLLPREILRAYTGR